jgi:hypothetical protein
MIDLGWGTTSKYEGKKVLVFYELLNIPTTKNTCTNTY